MRMPTLVLSIALSLAGCATGSTGNAWPSTVVTVEQVGLAKPMRLAVNYRILKGVPTGTTVLRLHVSERGRVKNVGVIQSSGHSNLDEAAIESAWDAVFRPYIQDGQAVEVTLVMPMHLR